MAEAVYPMIKLDTLLMTKKGNKKAELPYVKVSRIVLRLFGYTNGLAVLKTVLFGKACSK